MKAIRDIQQKIETACRNRPTSVDGYADSGLPEPQSEWSIAFVIGQVVLSTDSVKVNWDGPYWSWSTTLRVHDGLGLDWNEVETRLEWWGVALFELWLFPDRSIERARFPIQGKGCCDVP